MMRIETQLEKHTLNHWKSLKGLTQQLNISKFYKEAIFDWIYLKKTLQSHILPFLNPDTPLFGNTFITFRNKSLSCKGV